MISFNWPIIIPTTIVLYVLTIIFLPFNSIYATIMLFSLIGFWSKLPGVCIYEPLPILYVMDFVDVFAVIISIYIGPFQGAAYALFWNIFPRLCGAYRNWLVFVKDGVAQAIVCMFMPLINVAVGGNLLVAVTIFSIIRVPLYLVFCFILPHRNFVEQIIQTSVAGTIIVLVNMLYVKLFGDFFANLLNQGASFSWTLFLIASAIILLFSMTVFGFSPKKVGKNIGKNIKNIVRHQIKKSAEHEKGSERKDVEDIRLIKESLERK